MMKATLFFILVFFAFWLPVTSQEYRGAVSAEFGLSPKLEAGVEIELRKVFYPGSYFNRTFQGKLDYKFSKRWSVGTMYSFSLIDKDEEFSDEAEGESSDRNKISTDIVYQPKRFNNNLRLTNRFRFQIATLDDNRPKAYLRNKITLDYKVADKLNPYIALEPYYNLRLQKLKVIRAYLGNEMPLFNTVLDLCYIVELRLNEKTTDVQYILGLKVKLDYK